MRLLAILLALSAATAKRAAADTILVNQVPDKVAAYFSDPSGSQYFANNFTLSAPATADTITFWGGYYSSNIPVTDHFALRFFDDSTTGTIPGALTADYAITATRVDTGSIITYTKTNMYEYQATFTPTGFVAGNHWLSIVNTTGGTTSSSWVWATSNQFGTAAYSNTSPTDTFTPYSANLAFQLSETSSVAVPEPSSLALCGLAGLIGLGYARARRKPIAA